MAKSASKFRVFFQAHRFSVQTGITAYATAPGISSCRHRAMQKAETSQKLAKT
ncbi:hypothetical protein B4098_0589 [Heyndrickxia coagulans]|uniref:Uncharacterized protein n=1 Tax=Heyndrickxia coagulans TaxID=1398 RepID=A0A133KTL4_HEYCO|nr:hypothetical protein HMPREF3213_01479 [Heyndrickxia coagulans]KYC64915.1 hypothetical protein B4098_0589 [Heyndrickxia coagulans]